MFILVINIGQYFVHSALSATQYASLAQTVKKILGLQVLCVNYVKIVSKSSTQHLKRLANLPAKKSCPQFVFEYWI